MAVVGAQNPGIAGAVPSPVAASGGGDRVPPGTRVHVLNGGGAPITCTVTTPGTVRGLAVADQEVEIPNGSGIAGCKYFDVPADPFMDPADGLVGLAWSATTSVTFWVEGPVSS